MQNQIQQNQGQTTEDQESAGDPSLGAEGDGEGTSEASLGTPTPGAKKTTTVTPPANGKKTTATTAEGGEVKWSDDLPDDLKGESMLGRFKNVEELARSFVSAQKLMGKDKITVPDLKTVTPEELRGIYEKIGLPKEAKDYQLELAADSGLDGDFVEKLKVEAHKVGILPKQLQEVLGWYSTASKEVVNAHNETVLKEQKEGQAALRKDWGKAFDKNVLAAQLAIKDGASNEDLQYLESKGLLKDPTLIRIFSKLGSVLKEKELKGGSEVPNNVLAPKVAEAEAMKIMGDPKHPYNIGDHANHGMAVKEVSRLMAMAHPEKEKD